MSLLGHTYLARFISPLAAYNGLQARLMRLFLKRGGSLEVWVRQLAPAFRRRHGWLCEHPIPVPVMSPDEEERRRLAAHSQRHHRKRSF